MLHEAKLRYKIINMKKAFYCLNLDYFVLSETKLDSSFPSDPFAMNYMVFHARIELYNNEAADFLAKARKTKPFKSLPCDILIKALCNNLLIIT